MTNPKSFSLIELLVVIGILGALALGGVLAFRTYQPALELSGAVQELVGDLRYAEQLAVTEQKEYGIQFFASEGRYQLMKFGQSPEVIAVVEFSPKVSFQYISLTDDRVVFNPYGAAKEPGEVTLINTNNSTTTIQIKASGFVKVID